MTTVNSVIFALFYFHETSHLHVHVNPKQLQTIYMKYQECCHIIWLLLQSSLALVTTSGGKV